MLAFSWSQTESHWRIYVTVISNLWSSGGSVVKKPPAGDASSTPGSGRWQPTPVFLPGKSHGQGSLEGNSPWHLTESVGHD